ncbi:hypothetical protein HY416_00175 [Candidatus Kaiserbacteria bacterium]|nr:hypothetical protein [Candidatus Kaiserbacteria bacterium]
MTDEEYDLGYAMLEGHWRVRLICGSMPQIHVALQSIVVPMLTEHCIAFLPRLVEGESEDPLGDLARQMYEYLRAGRTIHLPNRDQIVDFSPAFCGAVEREAFIENACQDGKFLSRAFGELARCIPETYTMILALRAGFMWRNYTPMWMYFLHDFLKTEIDARLIIGLEYREALEMMFYFSDFDVVKRIGGYIL